MRQGERGRRKRAKKGGREGKERGNRQREKTDHKVERAGEPNSMPRLATEEKKMEEARRGVKGRQVRRK